MKIPMVDLQVQYESLKDEVDAAIGNVLDSCAFILGPEVEQFETAFAAVHGAEALDHAHRLVQNARGLLALRRLISTLWTIFIGCG